MTESEAQQRLLTVADLPNGWAHVATASDDDASPITVSPASCAESWTTLERIGDAWERAPVAVNTSFAVRRGTATITEEITDDPHLDPATLRIHLTTMIQECATYQVATAEGPTHIGTIVRAHPKTSENDIGLTQTVAKTDGTPAITRLAYLIEDTTIITLRSSGTPEVSADDFTHLVIAASKKARSSAAP